MNSMTYKGYLGSVAYSEKDQVFFGKIVTINAYIKDTLEKRIKTAAIL